MPVRRKSLKPDDNMEIVIKNGVLLIKTSDRKTVFPTIITHPNLDFDNATAIFVLDFYEIKYREVKFKSSGEDGLVDGKTAIEWLQNGCILMDVGGNEEPEKLKERLIHFDHSHNLLNEDKCATTICLDLVKRDMEVKPDELLIKLVNFVRENDLRGGREFLDLAHVCKISLEKLKDDEKLFYMKKLLNAYISNNGKPNSELFCEIFAEFARSKKKIPQKLLNYSEEVQKEKTQNIPDLARCTSPETADIIRMVLEETYLSQMEYKEAQKLYQRAKKISLKGNILLVPLESDNPHSHRAALGSGADIIPVKRGNGHVQIYTQDNTKGINLEDIVVVIRAEEAIINGDPLPKLANLRKDGIFGVWYYFKEAGMFMNGSSTARGQKPTKIDFEKIVQMIIAVQNGYMPYCKGGEYPCSEKCDLHSLNFKICEKHRAGVSPAKNNGRQRKGEILVFA